MVTSIARQSVLIKCNMKSSVMVGNYEFYYGAGFLAKIRNLSLPEECKPQELWELILPQFKMTGEEEREQYLVKMLSNYKVLDEYDDDMKELLQWGYHEENPWQVNI